MHATDAIWAFELTQQAAEISSRLPGTPPLKFVQGPLPEALSDAGERAVEPLPEATLEQARQAAEWASGIDDEELRHVVAKAARASLARAANDRSV